MWIIGECDWEQPALLQGPNEQHGPEGPGRDPETGGRPLHLEIQVSILLVSLLTLFVIVPFFIGKEKSY